MRLLRNFKIPKLRFKRIRMKSIREIEDIQVDYEKVEKEIVSHPRRNQPYPATDYKTIKEVFERSVRLYADRPFILQKPSHKEPYRTYTYREFGETVNQFGTTLSRMLPKDSKVVVVSETRYEWYVSYMALLCGAGIAVPTDKELPDNELENIINRSQARAVIYSAKKKDSIRKIEKNIPSVKYFIEMGSDDRIRGNRVGMEHMIREGIEFIESGDDSFSKTQIDPEAFRVLIFTSGTTARSKGVMICNRNLAANINGVSEYVKLTPEDRLFSVLPLHHTYESTIGFLLPMATGSSIAVCEGLRHIVPNMQEAQPTALLAVPLLIETMYKRIRKMIKKGKKETLVFSLVHVTNMMKTVHLDIKRRVFKEILDNFGGKLRYIVSAAAPIDGQIGKWIDGIGIKFLQGYGLTETAPIAALTPEYETPRYGSTGKAVKDTEIKVINPDENGEGEIAIKGPTVMLGYYEDEEETRKVMQDGFFLSGDIGRIDEDGYIYITGRSKNVIVTQNGKNIYPEEIEALLGDVEEIAEVMVYGKEEEDERTKKKKKEPEVTVAARIIPNYDRISEKYGPQTTEEEIRGILWEKVKEVNKKLEQYKAIKEIEIKKDAFEKTTTMKIKRYEELKKTV